MDYNLLKRMFLLKFATTIHVATNRSKDCHKGKIHMERPRMRRNVHATTAQWPCVYAVIRMPWRRKRTTFAP